MQVSECLGRVVEESSNAALLSYGGTGNGLYDHAEHCFGEWQQSTQKSAHRSSGIAGIDLSWREFHIKLDHECDGWSNMI